MHVPLSFVCLSPQLPSTALHQLMHSCNGKSPAEIVLGVFQQWMTASSLVAHALSLWPSNASRLSRWCNQEGQELAFIEHVCAVGCRGYAVCLLVRQQEGVPADLNAAEVVQRLSEFGAHVEDMSAENPERLIAAVGIAGRRP
jgi:hypothetical protein